MAAIEYTCASWRQFEARLDDYHRLSADRRQLVLFRGQRDAAWPVRSTLDRFIESHGLDGRKEILDRLLDRFRRECLGLNTAGFKWRSDLELELFARHAGVPSNVIDFTRSPYIAAFFAFESDEAPNSGSVAVWCLDRDRAAASRPDDIVIHDLIDVGDFNPRAVEQQAEFLKLINVVSLENEVASLLKLTIPWTARDEFLSRLASYGITRRSLFRDPDSAARTAAESVRIELTGYTR